MKIGVLGLQGDFYEHVKMLELLIDKKDIIIVKQPLDMKEIQGLIIPGGESTSIGKLMIEHGLDKEIINAQLPIFGTCAGLIILAKNIIGSNQFSLKLMNIDVERNGYGRQKESFEADLDIISLGLEAGEKFRGVFIRAPIIKSIGEGVEILSKLGDYPVLLRNGNLLVSTFHPELTDNPNIHRLFIEKMVAKH
ncbi:pyridoxal 5'-phosphate synthase glutaminase subunit PdxT [Candidatus Pacearchaeota archaeon]|nr:pyridoxal 5'-phosphate synthase glutaminase subunit PdxT [Candidatus Pacearchaeota archaeon]